jgi:predicted metal-dependent hydrolase
MKQQDYRFGRFLKAYNRGVRWGSKHFSPGLRLAITAGSEHYTATMASAVLALNLLDGCDPTMRALITWHALEEIEHKHVAYDVFAKLYPNSYPLRVFGFALATASIFGHAAYAYGFLAEQDVRKGRVTRAQLRQSAKNLLESDQRKFFLRLLRAMVQYYKPGFHPNQNDDRGLIARFEAEVPLTAAVHDAAE